jgi:hypothetical protein
VTYQPSRLLVGLETNLLWHPSHGDLLTEAAMLVGLGTRDPRTNFSVAVGPSLVSADLSLFETHSKYFSSALGLATQIQVLGLPTPILGGGLTGFLNLNPRQSFGGIRFTVAFGQLR